MLRWASQSLWKLCTNVTRRHLCIKTEICAQQNCSCAFLGTLNTNLKAYFFLSVFLSRHVYVMNEVNCESDSKLHINTSNHEIGIVSQLSAIHSVIRNLGTTGSTHPCRWVPVHIFDVLNCFDVQIKSTCESCTSCWCSVFSMCGHI